MILLETKMNNLHFGSRNTETICYGYVGNHYTLKREYEFREGL